MTANVDTQGNLTIYGVQCVTQVTAAPRGVVNVFNISVIQHSCYNGPGVMIYDEASRKVDCVSSLYNEFRPGFPDIWYAIAKRQ